MIEVFVWRRNREVGAITFLALPPRDRRDILGCPPRKLAKGLIRQLARGSSEGTVHDYRWRRTA